MCVRAVDQDKKTGNCGDRRKKRGKKTRRKFGQGKGQESTEEPEEAAKKR